MLEHEITEDYVRGFADADGCFSGHVLSFANTDLELLNKIQEFLSGLGISGTISVLQQGEYQPCGHLQITGLSNLIRYANKIGFCMERKQKALEKRIKELCAKGKAYNPDDYEKYLELSAQGMSYRKMAKQIGIPWITLHKRVYRGTYPLEKELLPEIREICN